jgi:hypothetical protein
VESLPVYASQLVEELDTSLPHRCIRANDTEIDAHRYAGKRELIDYLMLRLRATRAGDSNPTKPLLKG